MTDTDTPVNGARLLRDTLTRLRNTLGALVPAASDPDGNLRASAAPVGRLVVAPGQTIASAWGNTVFDQTMQTYATLGDRTNQWPAPWEGALSYLMDSHTPWLYRSGAWHPLPIGFLISGTGPPTQTDYTVLASVVSLAAPVVSGRRYRISANLSGTQQTAGATAIRIHDDQSLDTFIFNQAGLAASAPIVANGVALYVPTSTKTATLALQANAATGGTLRVAANAASLFVEDIGG